jgi:hypothetical protein
MPPSRPGKERQAGARPLSALRRPPATADCDCKTPLATNIENHRATTLSSLSYTYSGSWALFPGTTPNSILKAHSAHTVDRCILPWLS